MFLFVLMLCYIRLVTSLCLQNYLANTRGHYNHATLEITRNWSVVYYPRGSHFELNPFQDYIFNILRKNTSFLQEKNKYFQNKKKELCMVILVN